MSFAAHLAAQPLDTYHERVETAGPADVERALATSPTDWDGFLALLSPAAGAHLENMAERARALTRQRFGNVIQMYAPLYLSNECSNACVYCGFNRNTPIRRTTLSVEQALVEAQLLWDQGFRNLLLVSGESPRHVSPKFLMQVVGDLHRRFASIGLEVYPMATDDYRRLVAAGVDSLTVYQETYDRQLYARVHPSGRKADYDWRLACPERGAAAGLRRVNLGALLGLGVWRREAIHLGLHAAWLQRRYWQTQVCLSFPRLRHAAGMATPAQPVDDRDLVQLALALRLFLPDAGLVLSTREAPRLRDGLARLCITHMSAGSRTEPGGYAAPGEAGEQFQVEDRRSPAEVAAQLLAAGIEPVWKDWDGAFVDLPGAAAPRLETGG